MDKDDKGTNDGHGRKKLKGDSGNNSIPQSCPIESSEGSKCMAALPGEEYRKLVTRIVDANPFEFPSMEDQDEAGPNAPLDVNILMQKFGFIELKMIITWARKIPGYKNLLIDDQMALLKASFLELNVLRMAFRSMKMGENKIQFAGNVTLTVADSAKLGWGIDLVNCTVDFIKCLTDINLDKTEFAMLNAIVLTYPDAAGVKDKLAVIELQSKFLNCLEQYIREASPGDRSRYGKILLKLPLMRTTSAKGAERFLNLTLDGTIEMNELVWEMMNS